MRRRTTRMCTPWLHPCKDNRLVKAARSCLLQYRCLMVQCHEKLLHVLAIATQTHRETSGNTTNSSKGDTRNRCVALIDQEEKHKRYCLVDDNHSQRHVIVTRHDVSAPGTYQHQTAATGRHPAYQKATTYYNVETSWK